MKEHPILFSAPMVRAILDGRKTMTRRVVKFPAAWDGKHVFSNGSYGLKFGVSDDETVRRLPCPYGHPGDRLWVRETWAAPHHYDGHRPREIPEGVGLHFSATEERGGLLWRPSFFMPRWASRITLEVVSVRVERLQEMGLKDWVADFSPDCVQQEKALASFVGRENQTKMAQEFWDSINGKICPWDSNPWVWVIEWTNLNQTGGT
jgi:hypothetical protein